MPSSNEPLLRCVLGEIALLGPLTSDDLIEHLSGPGSPWQGDEFEQLAAIRDTPLGWSFLRYPTAAEFCSLLSLPPPLNEPIHSNAAEYGSRRAAKSRAANLTQTTFF